MYVYETGNENYDLLKEFAEHNRKYPTEAESILWSLLRNKYLGDKFRRQHIIGNYIADFVCLHNKLIIEIDGGYHFAGNQIVKDEERTEGLEELGFRIVRFTNDEVLFDTNRVINEIHEAMNTPSQTLQRLNLPPLLGRGGVGPQAPGPSMLLALAILDRWSIRRLICRRVHACSTSDRCTEPIISGNF